jgi:hypothetical protein
VIVRHPTDSPSFGETANFCYIGLDDVEGATIKEGSYLLGNAGRLVPAVNATDHASALGKGYVVIVTDTGHTGNGTDSAHGEYQDSKAKIGEAYRIENYDPSNNLYAKKICVHIPSIIDISILEVPDFYPCFQNSPRQHHRQGS